jgi:hypothetical protein
VVPFFIHVSRIIIQHYGALAQGKGNVYLLAKLFQFLSIQRCITDGYLHKLDIVSGIGFATVYSIVYMSFFGHFEDMSRSVEVVDRSKSVIKWSLAKLVTFSSVGSNRSGIN